MPAHRLLLATALLALPAPAAPASLAVFDPGQGAVSVQSPELRGISGMTATGPGTFRIVDDVDTAPRLHDLAVSVDPVLGTIATAVAGTHVPVASGSQFESVEHDPASGGFFLASEKDHTIRIVDAAGAETGSVGVPAIFALAQGNRSLESLAFHAATGILWAANEEPLVPDLGSGLVRLQRFVDGVPAGQFAYPLETPRNPGSGFNGLVELLALPDGRLLALERDYDGGFSIAVRLFEVRWTGATDVSSLGSLAGASVLPAAKTALLDPGDFPDGMLSGIANYEAMALGPVLADGSRSLLLGPSDDADNGFLVPEALYPLRLSGTSVAAGDPVPVLPVRLAVHPNPFRTTARLRYDLSEAGAVRLEILNLRGGLVRILENGARSPGVHHVVWNGRNERGLPVPAGSYFLRLAVPGAVMGERITRLP